MTRPGAPRRDFAAMQQLRRRVARLFATGKLTQAEIARELQVSRQSVSRWHEAWQSEEPDWIRGAGRAGRQPKLDAEQLGLVDEALRQGASTTRRVGRDRSGDRGPRTLSRAVGGAG